MLSLEIFWRTYKTGISKWCKLSTISHIRADQLCIHGIRKQNTDDYTVACIVKYKAAHRVLPSFIYQASDGMGLEDMVRRRETDTLQDRFRLTGLFMHR